MQKITIKNFGPITEIIDLEIKDLMVFIGPQATGKSTVAKLVYFFRTIDVVFRKFLSKKNTTFSKMIATEFENMFSIYINEKTRINYQFNGISKYYIEIKIDNVSKKPIITLSKLLEDTIISLDEEFNLAKTTKLRISTFKEEIVSALSQKIKIDNLSFFIPAERTSEDNETSISTFYHKLLLDIKDGGNFTQLASINGYLMQYNGLLSISEQILKGKHSIEDGEEYIYLSNKKKIPIETTSSGQQSSSKILMILSYFFVNQYNPYLIIEEPENHLYPSGQTAITQAASFFMNFTKSQLLLTTHSPYILTSLNNLMFAYKTAQISSEVAEKVDKIIAKEKWINPENVGVYYVGGEGNEGRIKSIINPNTGLIGVNELDDASDYIGDEFDAIMKIKRTFKSVPQ